MGVMRPDTGPRLLRNYTQKSNVDPSGFVAPPSFVTLSEAPGAATFILMVTAAQMALHTAKELPR